MNRIEKLFSLKPQGGILSVYITAGYPTADSTISVIESLVASGVDMIEVGVPFSDPMADGVVIQESSSVALSGGITIRKIFDDIEEVRKRDDSTPLVLMSYLNPLMRYGIRRLFERSRGVGIDAFIVPDLPFAEYLEDWEPLCREFGIPCVMLITPETSDDRIRLIDSRCDGGFIYMVSSASTTGTRQAMSRSSMAYFERVARLGLKNKLLVGFGISNRVTREAAETYSQGVIVGSLFIKCLRQYPGGIPSAVNALHAALDS